MDLINTIGTRVRVRDEHADRLIAAGYTHPQPAQTTGEQPARPARRTTTRGATRTARRTAGGGKRS
ncbi:MAG: hypothetical protein GEV28_27860 [Actinophytocola sp.]|uniref:hypothetical protein n=1 Tax=Actinophytocola sp. TaxID=1872138 RepID=UPI0013299A19|nr:hypothetical protein [Actinophytocola sp.]MPZ84002.1 hypothetical protein [Actinophytocola sp.]